MDKQIKKFKFFLSVLLLFLATGSAFAQDSDWSLQLNWPDSPGGTPLDSGSGIAKLVKYFYEWGIGLGVIIFFGILVYAGFLYITSAGNPSKMKSAKSKIISGFSGVLLLLGSYLLLNTINPELTNIKTISPPDPQAGFGEFQAGLNVKENLCEFAFTTIQEVENNDSAGTDIETFFTVPGMTATNDNFFPTESIACKPVDEHKQILEVRKNEIDGYYMLVKSYSGEEVDENNRVSYKDNDNLEDELEELYSKRYKQTTEITIKEDDDVLKVLKKSFHKKNYNIFGKDDEACEDLLGNEKFNRPRCLTLDPENRKLKEWVKVGYPSLLEAFEEIRKDNDGQLAGSSYNKCPSEYEVASDGAGCSIAFYDGESKPIPFVNWGSTPTCRHQISRPAATMDHFDGIVDREANCMELIRHERELDIDLPTYTLKIINKEPKGSYESKLTAKSNGENLGTVSNEQTKEFEVDANSSIILIGDPGSQNMSYRKIELSTNNKECNETAPSGQVECEFSISGNTNATLDITGNLN